MRINKMITRLVLSANVLRSVWTICMLDICARKRIERENTWKRRRCAKYAAVVHLPRNITGTAREQGKKREFKRKKRKKKERIWEKKEQGKRENLKEKKSKEKERIWEKKEQGIKREFERRKSKEKERIWEKQIGRKRERIWDKKEQGKTIKFERNK